MINILIFNKIPQLSLIKSKLKHFVDSSFTYKNSSAWHILSNY